MSGAAPTPDLGLVPVTDSWTRLEDVSRVLGHTDNSFPARDRSRTRFKMAAPGILVASVLGTPAWMLLGPALAVPLVVLGLLAPALVLVDRARKSHGGALRLFPEDATPIARADATIAASAHAAAHVSSLEAVQVLADQVATRNAAARSLHESWQRFRSTPIGLYESASEEDARFRVKERDKIVTRLAGLEEARTLLEEVASAEFPGFMPLRSDLSTPKDASAQLEASTRELRAAFERTRLNRSSPTTDRDLA